MLNSKNREGMKLKEIKEIKDNLKNVQKVHPSVMDENKHSLVQLKSEAYPDYKVTINNDGSIKVNVNSIIISEYTTGLTFYLMESANKILAGQINPVGKFFQSLWVIMDKFNQYRNSNYSFVNFTVEEALVLAEALADANRSMLSHNSMNLLLKLVNHALNIRQGTLPEKVINVVEDFCHRISTDFHIVVENQCNIIRINYSSEEQKQKIYDELDPELIQFKASNITKQTEGVTTEEKQIVEFVIPNQDEEGDEFE